MRFFFTFRTVERKVFHLGIFSYHSTGFIAADRTKYPLCLAQLFPLQAISIFDFSKLYHIQLSPQKEQQLDTIDFQNKIYYPTSIGIPKKQGEYALWFQENQAASR